MKYLSIILISFLIASCGPSANEKNNDFIHAVEFSLEKGNVIEVPSESRSNQDGGTTIREFTIPGDKNAYYARFYVRLINPDFEMGSHRVDCYYKFLTGGDEQLLPNLKSKELYMKITKEQLN